MQVEGSKQVRGTTHQKSSLEVRKAGTYLVLCPGEALSNELTLKRDALLQLKTIIVLGQARLALLVYHQDELYHALEFLSTYIYCFLLQSVVSSL